VSDPYESSARKKERAEEAARNRRLTWYFGGGIGLVAVAAVLYFTLFSGPKAGESPLSVDQHDAANMKFLDKRLSELNTLLTDATISASEKAGYQKEKKVLEKERDELLKKRPDLKK
jgi:hypothetical protein